MFYLHSLEYKNVSEIWYKIFIIGLLNLQISLIHIFLFLEGSNKTSLFKKIMECSNMIYISFSHEPFLLK